ncbi:Asparagine synthase family protein [marine gamma proteobacterium HTCC2148]|nr:Asparagine synthase family protein [marine gamma proteobacterium HTCC2148]
MSGIVGLVRYDQQGVTRNQIESLLQQMAYRGPDGMHCWVDGQVGFGHAMLHTTPESLHEVQPLHVPERNLTLVMDGRLDNGLELRGRILSLGMSVPRLTDADLVLAAYLVWGEACVDHLEGDFALVLWDSSSQRLFCARDRIGHRPFYYYHSDGLFAFASELHLLLTLPEVSRRPDTVYRTEHLATEWHSRERTLWADIKRLPAAHILSLRGCELEKKEYWQPDFNAQLYYPSYEDYVEHYREVHDTTVQRMSRSHKPLACTVSGGLDSSAIFATSKWLEGQGRLRAPGVQAYTLDFSHDEDANELAYARAVTDYLGCELNAVLPSDYPLDWYLQRAEHRAEAYCIPTSTMSNKLRQQVASGGNRALIGGLGGDQWLGFGENCYMELLANRQWRSLHSIWREDAKARGAARAGYYIARYGLAPLLPRVIKRPLQRWRDNREHLATGRHWLGPGGADSLERGAQMAWRKPRNGFRWAGQQADWSRLLNGRVANGLEMTQQFTAEAGLELRSPYWSEAMIQLSISLPKHLLYGQLLDRPLHRRAMVGRLPERVLQRDSKAEFSVTYTGIMAQATALVSASMTQSVALGLQEPYIHKAVEAEHAEPIGDECDGLWELCNVLAATQSLPPRGDSDTDPHSVDYASR